MQQIFWIEHILPAAEELIISYYKADNIYLRITSDFRDQNVIRG